MCCSPVGPRKNLRSAVSGVVAEIPEKLVLRLQNAIRPLKTAFQAQTRAYLKRLGPDLLIPGVRRGVCLSEVRSIRAIELQTRENSQPRS